MGLGVSWDPSGPKEDLASFRRMSEPAVLRTLRRDPSVRWLFWDSRRHTCGKHLYELLRYRGELAGTFADGQVYIYTVRSEESMYLDLLRELMTYGDPRPSRVDRSGVGTSSAFGKSLRFSLRDRVVPILTTKRVYVKGVIKELLWFLRGSTRDDSLRRDNVMIWAGNSSREYLDSVGLTRYDEGELGPIYGYQWRNWGRPYRKTESPKDPTPVLTPVPKETDQLAEIIRLIREQPASRRMVMSAWNVSQLTEMALPPCHVLCQFYVHEEATDEEEGPPRKMLSCCVYQRSADVFLGVPFNVASYAYLTHMIAHVTGCEAHELLMQFGDTHLYETHTTQAVAQIAREASVHAFPTIKPFDVSVRDIDAFEYAHFEFDPTTPYVHEASLPAPMAV
eukprot:835221-Prorocentrum_minimum.AAC.7